MTFFVPFHSIPLFFNCNTDFQIWSLIWFKENQILKIRTEIVSITVLVYLWNIC